MSGVLHRLVAAFVAPAERPEATAGAWLAPSPAAPPAVAVLARAPQAVAVGAAAALALADGAAVVVLWGARPSAVRAPATLAARRLATKLTARGHATTATGRLAVVDLDDAPIETAARVAAAVDVPTVVVVAGPRDERVDRVLAAHDRVLVAGDDPVAALAAESVRGLGVTAATLALPDAPAARLLAATGVALVAPWRTPVEEALA